MQPPKPNDASSTPHSPDNAPAGSKESGSKESGVGGSRHGQAVTGAFDATTLEVMPSEEVTALHLLRHGEVESLLERAVRGQSDVKLSPDGEHQTRRLVEFMGEHESEPDRIYTSDLQRCRILGEALAERFDLELHTTPRLREQSMGTWEGLPWSRISAEHGKLINDYWDDYANVAPPGGESMRDMQTRVVAFWNEVRTEHTGRRIHFVTHIGVIRALLCELLHHPLEEALRFAPAVASHTSILQSDTGSVLNTLGERPWLYASPGHRAPEPR